MKKIFIYVILTLLMSNLHAQFFKPKNFSVKDTFVIGSNTITKDDTLLTMRTFRQFATQMQVILDGGSGGESSPLTELTQYSSSFTQYPVFDSDSRIFPSAVGYGTESLGAYELYSQTLNPSDLPDILIVDTLYAGILQTGSNSGSLEWCIDVATGPRVVVFEVGGIIDYRPTGDALTLLDDEPGKDYLSVYGQTAPGKGITILANYWNVRASNVLIQHLKFRMGDEFSGSVVSSDLDNITISSYASNVILDHCSFSWSQDESVNGYADNFTLSNCFIYNPLNLSRHVNEGGLHEPEDHGFLILLEGQNNTMYNNVLYRGRYRNPAIGSAADNTVIINNIFQSPGYDVGGSLAGGDIVYVSNMSRQVSGYDFYNDKAANLLSGIGSLYARDNWCEYRENNPGASEISLFVNSIGMSMAGSSFADLSEYNERTPQELWSQLPQEVGAFYWNRDFHDSLNIAQLKNLEGGKINSPMPLPARAYNDGEDGDYGTNGSMVNGYDWSGNNQTLIINGSTYTLNSDCNNISEVLTEINSVLPVGFEAVSHPETDYVILQTTATGSGVSFTLSGTACGTLGMNQETYYGEDGDGGKYPDYASVYESLSLPAYPNCDDDGDGVTNIQQMAYEMGQGIR